MYSLFYTVKYSIFAYSPTSLTATNIGALYCFDSTGKERDEETGYGYFGARYLDHELMTMWLSVDPMADKYPSISPYAYCARKSEVGTKSESKTATNSPVEV